MPKYFIDLFSGIGGFALGAYWAGLRFDRHFFSEVDPYAIKVYQQRFPDSEPLGDIIRIDGHALPEGEYIIAGGFPCQDISVAGKGAGLDGGRSGLWFQYARLIDELRPRYAIMENVGALAFRGLDRVLGSLAEIGYDAEWQDIRASDVGAPHRRERLWIVAYPNRDSKPGQPINEGSRQGIVVPDPLRGGLGGVLQPEPERGCGIEADTGRDGEARAMADAEGSGLPGWEMRGHSREGFSGSRESGRAIGDNWRVEPDVGRVAHGVPSRVDRLKCLGNSIVPQIAELIFQQIAIVDEWS